MVLALAAAHSAQAAGAGATALTFNTSARASGMGGAGVANVWDGDTNLWANPALLAFRPGVRYATFHSLLVPDLADDIVLDKQELTFGYAGIGVLYAHAPFDNVYLDMGYHTATDENGDPIGRFHAWQKSRSLGLGLGLTQVSDRFFGTRLNGWFDVGLGYVWHDYEDRIAPDSILQDSGGNVQGQANSHDYGMVARITALNTLERFESMADAPVGLVVAATYGWAKTNATSEFLVHVDQDQSDPMPTAYQRGWAVRAEIVPAPDFMSGAPRLLRQSLSPLVAWTYARQTQQPGYVWTGSDYEYDRDTSGRFDVDSNGHEILLMNVFYLRKGHTTDIASFIDDDTDGWGLNLQAGRYGGFRYDGFRYDKATVPQALGLQDVESESWHFWVDVAAILDRE